MLHKLIASLFSAALCLAPVRAQQQQSPPPQNQPAPAQREQEETVRVGSSAVQVDVIVTDKTGRRITGLTAADFQVLDENKPVTIDFFSAIEGSRVSRAENRGAAAADGAGKAGAAAPAATTSLLRPG